MITKDLPTNIPVFPLSNFIIFPNATVPLNIFEPRYLEMINDSMKSNKMIGMIQPKNSNTDVETPDLHNIGCLGKIISFTETNDGRYLIELKGLIRFQKEKEVETKKQYRILEVNFENFYEDLSLENQDLNFFDLKLIFKYLKSFFVKKGFIINWKALEKLKIDETINALAMASPFSLEEIQVLLEASNIDVRKNKMAQILSTYTNDLFNNTTLQ